MDARPYFAALETGTQPWQSQHFRRRRDGSVYPSAPKWFIDIIADWAATKGVDISAWGAATKIMTEGSALFRNGRPRRHLHARNSGPIRPHRR